MKVLIVGGSGFIGQQLCQELLAVGHQVVVLSRNLAQTRATLQQKVEVMGWDAFTVGKPKNSGEAFDCIINLAGESIGDGRWTQSRKDKILASRLGTTQAIVEFIKNQTIKPKVLINASAIGFYGPNQAEILTESSPAGHDFLATVCKAWEGEANQAKQYGVRVVPVRIGVVLGNGRALPRLLLPFKFYVGGHTGSGNQWFSWIHVQELVQIIRFLAEHDAIDGPVNATAPQPLKMRDFCTVLSRVLGKPSWLPVPAFILRLALGEMADLVLNGQQVIPQKLLNAGYKFQYPTAEQALQEILKSGH